MPRLVGVLLGRSMRAARDSAYPLVSGAELADWAGEQRGVVEADIQGLIEETEAAEGIVACGGDPGGLRFVRIARKWCTADEVVDWATKLQEVLIVDEYELSSELTEAGDFELDDQVLVVVGGSWDLLQSQSDRWWINGDWPPRDSKYSYDRHTFVGVVIERVSRAWGCRDVDLLRQVDDRRTVTRVIGYRNGEPIESEVLRITRQ